jgi:hypothetical protein
MINPSRMRQKMQLGQVTSRIEKGIEEHVGTWRVTLRVAASVWEGIFDNAKMLMSERVV